MQNDNPFAPPEAEVRDVRLEAEVAIPVEVLKKIKMAWVAGLISSSLTLLFSVFNIQGFGLVNLVDVALMLGLVFGIYRRSRACAVVMLIYFIVAKIIIIAETGQVSGIFLGLVFLYFYWQGVSGTFAYRKLLKSVSAQPARTQP